MKKFNEDTIKNLEEKYAGKNLTATELAKITKRSTTVIYTLKNRYGRLPTITEVLTRIAHRPASKIFNKNFTMENYLNYCKLNNLNKNRPSSLDAFKNYLDKGDKKW